MEPTITRPMLAKQADLMQLDYPVASTPKIDGIRALVLNGEVLSRSMKKIRNKKIQDALGGLPAGLDGELVSLSNNFQESTSAVMSEESDIPWRYCIFDFIDQTKDTVEPYANRVRALSELLERGRLNRHCEILLPTYVYDQHHLLDICQQHLTDGYEGTMLRKPDGLWKNGRSTVREGLLLKVKEFQDAEATIIGFQELNHNDNEATVNALGLTERSSAKENKTAGGILGSFIVQLCDDPSIQFKIGTGLTAAQRSDFWKRQDELIGSIVKFKFFEQGIKSATGCPRHPVFIGFRHPDDLG